MADKKETTPAVVPAYAPFPAPSVAKPETEKAE